MMWLARRRRRAEFMIIGALHTGAELTGGHLMDRTGLSPGRLYAALIAMERDGQVAARWQDGPGPRRLFYRLTTRCAR